MRRPAVVIELEPGQQLPYEVAAQRGATIAGTTRNGQHLRARRPSVDLNSPPTAEGSYREIAAPRVCSLTDQFGQCAEGVDGVVLQRLWHRLAFDILRGDQAAHHGKPVIIID